MSENRTGPSATIARSLADLAAMVRFYSRLSPPPLSRLDDPASPPAFGSALRMLPPAALAIAAPGAIVLALLSPTQLSSPAVAALTVIVATLVTGAFHEDGLADIADGFGSGATVERRLEIMKDSRIGAFGGVALAAQFMLRVILVGDLLERFDGWTSAALLLGIAAPARVAPLALAALMPPARSDGLGRSAGRPEPTALAIAAGLAGAFYVATAVPLVGPTATLVGAAACGATLFGLARLAMAKIGGFTGDVLGAGTILAEIALLAGLTAA